MFSFYPHEAKWVVHWVGEWRWQKFNRFKRWLCCHCPAFVVTCLELHCCCFLPVSLKIVNNLCRKMLINDREKHAKLHSRCNSASVLLLRMKMNESLCVILHYSCTYRFLNATRAAEIAGNPRRSCPLTEPLFIQRSMSGPWMKNVICGLQQHLIIACEVNHHAWASVGSKNEYGSSPTFLISLGIE